MPRHTHPKGGKQRAGKQRRCGNPSYAFREQAPRGVPVYQCKSCGAFHPAKGGSRRGKKR